MTKGRLIVIGGGARSGKSRFALDLAARLPGPHVFIATAEAGDDEMRARIARHRAERGAGWTTVEEPLDVAGALDAAAADVAVIDCLTFWISNLLLAEHDETMIVAQLERLVSVAQRRPRTTVVVTNEVGMGLVPDTPLGRLFRDVTGRAHQRLARAADEVYLGALGIMLRVKPSPLVA